MFRVLRVLGTKPAPETVFDLLASQVQRQKKKPDRPTPAKRPARPLAQAPLVPRDALPAAKEIRVRSPNTRIEHHAVDNAVGF